MIEDLLRAARIESALGGLVEAAREIPVESREGFLSYVAMKLNFAWDAELTKGWTKECCTERDGAICMRCGENLP